MARYDSLLAAVGDTPIVGLPSSFSQLTSAITKVS